MLFPKYSKTCARRPRRPNGRVSPAAGPLPTSPQGYVENFDDTLFPLLRRFKPAISGYGSLRQVQTLVRRLLVRLITLPVLAGGEGTHFPDQPSLLVATRVQRNYAGGAHLIRFQTTEPIPFYRKHSPKNSAWSRQHKIDRLAPIESLHEMDKAHTHILFLTCAPPAERLTAAFHLRRNHLPFTARAR